ncbi:DNA polymerase III subunit delta [Candidatus Marithrix sp. Canyon 246]|uniref:DNA polymerase III subunit delta n=3 Tax=Candidatus Marithrix sp. Canyon 246 TaxID=1827136 RepID=UPI00084A17D4|nr:DNA polymerase III subunit delta [Candidatus Marithrix sp. Canyon 246]
MKLQASQLHNHLKQQKLAPIYLLTGDEALQMMESVDLIRNCARQQDFSERVILTLETGFDWSSLDQEANSFSLFANKRLLELRLANKSPGKDGGAALVAYTKQLPADTVLLITADKLDASQQKTKWFKSIEQSGVVIQIWPLNALELPRWIAARMNKYGLKPDSEVMNIIAERSEGHLLACSQEIEKLHLLYGSGQITIAQVTEAVADTARFQIFDWVDTMLAGKVKRGIHQLKHLEQEGVAEILVAWALNREIRNLCYITAAIQNRQSQEQVFKTYRIWSNRKSSVSNAIRRHPQAKTWQAFLKETVEIDAIIKGVKKGNSWDALQQLSLKVAGVKLFK